MVRRCARLRGATDSLVACVVVAGGSAVYWITKECGLAEERLEGESVVCKRERATGSAGGALLQVDVWHVHAALVLI